MPSAAEQAPVVERIDPYQEWRRKEGAPLVGGVYIKDMKQVEVSTEGAALQEGEISRFFMLGAKISSRDRSGTLMPGFALAKRLAQRTGGDALIESSAGANRIILRFGVCENG